jgi:hypothetical protein
LKIDDKKSAETKERKKLRDQRNIEKIYERNFFHASALGSYQELRLKDFLFETSKILAFFP